MSIATDRLSSALLLCFEPLIMMESNNEGLSTPLWQKCILLSCHDIANYCNEGRYASIICSVLSHCFEGLWYHHWDNLVSGLVLSVYLSVFGKFLLSSFLQLQPALPAYLRKSWTVPQTAEFGHQWRLFWIWFSLIDGEVQGLEWDKWLSHCLFHRKRKKSHPAENTDRDERNERSVSPKIPVKIKLWKSIFSQIFDI